MLEAEIVLACGSILLIVPGAANSEGRHGLSTNALGALSGAAAAGRGLYHRDKGEGFKVTATRSRQTTATVVPAILGAILGLVVLVFYSNTGTIAGGSFTIRNFDETKWVALSGVAILTNLFILLQRIQTVRIRINEIDVIIFLIFGWMGLSLLWSPDPKYGALAILHASLLLVFYCNSRAIHPEAIDNFIHAVSLVSLTGIMVIPILFNDYLLDRGFGNINFVAEFASISLCAALAFWNKGSVGRPQELSGRPTSRWPIWLQDFSRCAEATILSVRKRVPKCPPIKTRSFADLGQNPLAFRNHLHCGPTGCCLAEKDSHLHKI
ncbi:MAG: hypothetical protein QF398_01995 [Alphaproteobacteria bacterium]|nr:hypothetical protein [Alphaproteobacteria bacterium]